MNQEACDDVLNTSTSLIKERKKKADFKLDTMLRNKSNSFAFKNFIEEQHILLQKKKKKEKRQYHLNISAEIINAERKLVSFISC